MAGATSAKRSLSSSLSIKIPPASKSAKGGRGRTCARSANPTQLPHTQRVSCALAQKACRDGYTVYYARAPRLFVDPDPAHGDGRFARLFRMLTRVDLLLLDDWGPDRLTANQRRDMMEII